jgi:hypothetical protein
MAPGCLHAIGLSLVAVLPPLQRHVLKLVSSQLVSGKLEAAIGPGAASTVP